MLIRTTIICATAFAMASPALAEGSGDAFRGKAYAEAMCGACHSIGADETASANPKATPFRSIKFDLKSADELATWLNTEHPSIQSLINQRQAEDIVAYGATVKTGAAK